MVLSVSEFASGEASGSPEASGEAGLTITDVTYGNKYVATAATAGSVGYSEMAKFMNMGGNTAQYTYRSALKVDADGIVADETIPALLTKVGSYDGASAAGGEMNLNGPFFNGIIVDSADYVIDGMTIRASVDGANDFQGEGAAVLAQGSAS